MHKRFGTRIANQAFCTFCGWSGAHWYGKGSKGNAQGELLWHMDKSPKCAELRLQRPRKTQEVRCEL